MKIVVLGLSLSSSWGNGHATTYRALLGVLAARGHDVLFLERDVPWYAAHRDLPSPDFCRLAFYTDLADLHRWRPQIAGADAVVVGSYVPEGIAAGDFVLNVAAGITAFYDIDTPVTLAALARGEESYIAIRQIPGYDLYLSFSGGRMLDVLRHHGARMPVALYCSVDPAAYSPRDVPQRWDLSYLGTYSQDRQPGLNRLLLQVARAAPDLRFAVAGPQYPADIVWPDNVERIEHLPPARHADFYCASRYTLNITRADMIEAGHSPSVRLFEAAACGTAIISDPWDGLDTLLGPGEIVVARTTQDVLAALSTPTRRRDDQAQAARRRILAGHTAGHRGAELESALRAAAKARTPLLVD